MADWRSRHATAAQRARRRQPDPTARKLDRRGQIAPAVTVPRNACPDCGHPNLVHRDGVCLTVGCDCGRTP